MIAGAVGQVLLEHEAADVLLPAHELVRVAAAAAAALQHVAAADVPGVGQPAGRTERASRLLANDLGQRLVDRHGGSSVPGRKREPAARSAQSPPPAAATMTARERRLEGSVAREVPHVPAFRCA